MKNHRVTSFAPSIETLESRIAPAGVVILTQTGAGLKISGDASNNDVTITQANPGEFIVTGNDGTMVQIGNGTPAAAQTVIGIAGDIVADLKEGGDDLRFIGVFVPKSLTVNFGNKDVSAANNKLFLEDTLIGKNLNVTGSVAGDDVEFRGTFVMVNGGATLKLGDGQNDVDFQASVVNQIDGNLFFSGGTDQDQVKSQGGGVVASQIRIGGNLTIQAGAGTNSIEFEPDDQLFIGGAVSITNKNVNQNVTVTLRTQDASGNTIIGGGLVIKNGSGAAANTIRGGSTLEIGGAVLVVNGDQAAGMTATTIGADTLLNVGKGVTFKNGSGDFSTLMVAGGHKIGGALSYLGKAGSDALQFSGLVNAEIEGSITFRGGPGTSALIINSYLINVGGGINVKGGAERDVVTVRGIGSIKGSVIADLGGGPNQSMEMGALSYALTVGGSVKVKGGAPGGAGMGLTFSGLRVNILGGLQVFGTSVQDMVQLSHSLVNGAIAIKTFAGEDTVMADQLTALNTVKIATGVGADTINIERSGETGVSEFLKAVSIDMGEGNDLLEIGSGIAANGAIFRKTVFLNGGAGTDNRSVGPNLNSFDVAGQPTVVNFEAGA